MTNIPEPESYFSAISSLLIEAQRNGYFTAKKPIENCMESLNLNSNPFRVIRPMIFMPTSLVISMERLPVIIRKDSNCGYSMDLNIRDRATMIGHMHITPFGVLILNNGSNGDIVINNKPMAIKTRRLITASTKIRLGPFMHGYLRIDVKDSKDIEANISFAKERHQDFFCKNCGLICFESPSYLKLFPDPEWNQDFVGEIKPLEMKIVDKVNKMPFEEIVELKRKFLGYLAEQPEALEPCECNARD